MVKEIESAPVVHNEIPQEYMNLFQIDPELKKRMKGLSLGLVFLECVLGLLNLSKEKGKLSFDTKLFSIKNMEVVIKRKIESYQQIVKNVALPIIEMGFNLLTTVGGGALKGVSKGGAVATRGISSNLESKHQADVTGYDHIYRGEEHFVEYFKKSKQDSDQNNDRLLELWKEQVRQEQEAIRSSVAPAA